MKLNHDCIRDILLTVEEESKYGAFVRLPNEKFERLKKYDVDVVRYHVRQCLLSCYFYNVDDDFSGYYLIADLSPEGHAYVGKLRDDTIFAKTKAIAAKVGASSLDVFVQIASNVITDLIKSQSGIS